MPLSWNSIRDRAFVGIDRIGQVFADEVFRVCKLKHQELQLHFIKAIPDVQDVIIRALYVPDTPPS